MGVVLPSAQAVEIRTDDADTLCLAVDGVLYLDGKTEGNVRVWQKLFQMAGGAATGAYFSGDRGVEETARIIQNRVQLMLDEM